MSGHRLAAVAIHGLTRRDRGLILAELPLADQQVLRGYLTELDELGFERMDVPPVAATAAARPADAASAIRGAAAADMLEVLGHEPASLIAHFLGIEAWPWVSGFIEMLAPARRALVRAALAADSVPAPARAHFLLETVAAALKTGQSHPAARLSRLGALLAKAKSWTP